MASKKPPRPHPDLTDPYIGAAGTDYNRILQKCQDDDVILDHDRLCDQLAGCIEHFMWTASSPQIRLMEEVRVAVKQMEWKELVYWLGKINQLGKPAIRACRLVLVGK